MPERPRESRVFLAWASLLTLVAAATFYGAGRRACGGDWPAPLDDVYIHYDFARAWATGHPFEWIAGQGYSSGETSPAYAFVLAMGYALGFRGMAIGLFAALVAVAAVLVAMRTIGTLVRPAGGWVPPLAATMLVTCGTLDFALWSGMEVALFGAVAASLIAAAHRARTAGPIGRSRLQWRVGLWGGLLVLVRPEAAVVVFVATVAVARRPGPRSAFAAAVRVALPGALATFGLAGLNYLFTGEAASAGALLKLLSSNPFATDADRAKDYLTNLATFVLRLRHDLGDGAGRFAWLLPLLALASLGSRRTRGMGATCLVSALAFALLASWNGAARYQNLRDYMPAVLLGLYASAFGLAALARHRSLRRVGVAVAIAGILLGASHVPEAARFYARASRNIHDQQVLVGRRLARDAPVGALLLVGDAGAIPYVSRLATVDILGLGGYRGLPLVRAAVNGEAASLELLERLPPNERPTLLALYPNWFPGITGQFGRERDHVTIEDNVICGGVTKGIYDADWSAMGDGLSEAPGVPGTGTILDELDVADVVSEEAHAYVSPAPDGGWTLFDIRASGEIARRFDGGRIVPEGEAESFVLSTAVPAGGELLVRTDGTPADVTFAASAPGASGRVPLVAGTTPPGAWTLLRARLPVALRAGTRITIHVRGGELHDFHAWLALGNP